jgi:hypothetical protein
VSYVAVVTFQLRAGLGLFAAHLTARNLEARRVGGCKEQASLSKQEAIWKVTQTWIEVRCPKQQPARGVPNRAMLGGLADKLRVAVNG